METTNLPDIPTLISLLNPPPLTNPHLPPSLPPTTIQTSTKELYTSLPDHPLPLPFQSTVPEEQQQQQQQQHHPPPLNSILIHLIQHIIPSLSPSSLSPRYYGFVTGGCTPAARLADLVVSGYDQNVGVHLPAESVATAVEAGAGEMLWGLGGLLGMERGRGQGQGQGGGDRDGDGDGKEAFAGWKGGFTTGATAANVVGLAMGREWVVGEKGRRMRRMGKVGDDDDDDGVFSVGDMGLLEACRVTEINNFQVLTTAPHSSLRKAAAVVGLGRRAVVDVGFGGGDGKEVEEDGGQMIGCKFDFERLEEGLKGVGEGKVSIVVVSCGEVNTGGFATHGYEEMERIRKLCDEYGAWLHVDGAFGIYARLLEGSGPEFDRVASGGRGMELADSVAADAHKLLNVPYDCGFYFTRHPEMAERVFQNPNAAYLDVGQASDGIQSPLNIGLENSRRFRALPVYATLVSYGRLGYVDMLQRQVRFARAVARYIHDHPDLEILPRSLQQKKNVSSEIYIVVLFRAKDKVLNNELVKRINETLQIYVSGTVWEGEPASRIAVSNWQVDIERDFEIVKRVLESVLDIWKTRSKRT